MILGEFSSINPFDFAQATLVGKDGKIANKFQLSFLIISDHFGGKRLEEVWNDQNWVF